MSDNGAFAFDPISILTSLTSLTHTHIHNNIDESATKENDNVIRQEKRKKERKNLGKFLIWVFGCDYGNKR